MALIVQGAGDVHRRELREPCAHATDANSQPPLSDIDWSGRAVTVMGLGHHGGGVAAARYLAERGARVTISDAADLLTLADSISKLADAPIAAFHLAGHDAADFRADFVVVNPAVRPDHECLRLARDAGARLITEIELFLSNCPARVIGVTGTNGKSTTCSLLHAILSAAGRRSWLGGNIGRSLLANLEQMTFDDWVVLELSSFQLAHLSPAARRPDVAVLTNCTPNHLDWHGTHADYVAAKQRILGDAQSCQHFVFNDHNALAGSWTPRADRLAVCGWPLEMIPPLGVPGAHNRQNAACAAAAAVIAGVDRATIIAALADFDGLPHRIELVARAAGRRFYNDSKATSPAATQAALAAIDGPVWLLAGGDGKGADFGELAQAVVRQARGAAVFGAARHRLRSAIESASRSFEATAVENLSDAFAWCLARSQPGDAILLSPACASYDQFRDFAARGEAFRALARQLVARGAD